MALDMGESDAAPFGARLGDQRCVMACGWLTRSSGLEQDKGRFSVCFALIVLRDSAFHSKDRRPRFDKPSVNF